jgi:hypothetical protein
MRPPEITLAALIFVSFEKVIVVSLQNRRCARRGGSFCEEHGNYRDLTIQCVKPTVFHDFALCESFVFGDFENKFENEVPYDICAPFKKSGFPIQFS